MSLEIETKLELTESDARALLAAGVAGAPVDQLNAYYDSGWRLARSGATLRVRCCLGVRGAVLTAKLPVAWVGATRTMREMETVLGRPIASGRVAPRELAIRPALPEPIAEALASLGIVRLERVGWLRNRRVTIQVDGGMLELDRIQLPDGAIVYEAEIEAQDPRVRERLTDIVRRLAPGAQASRASKFERFRRAISATGEPEKHTIGDS